MKTQTIRNCDRCFKEDSINTINGLCASCQNLNAQQILNESEGLTTEEKTPLYLSKLAKGDLKTK